MTGGGDGGGGGVGGGVGGGEGGSGEGGGGELGGLGGEGGTPSGLGGGGGEGGGVGGGRGGVPGGEAGGGVGGEFGGSDGGGDSRTSAQHRTALMRVPASVAKSHLLTLEASRSTAQYPRFSPLQSPQVLQGVDDHVRMESYPQPDPRATPARSSSCVQSRAPIESHQSKALLSPENLRWPGQGLVYSPST